VTTISVLRFAASSTISSAKVRQRRFGSWPLTTIRSWSAAGRRAARSSVAGHSIRRRPSTIRTVGRVTWKS
jgi:hypothetical protein